MSGSGFIATPSVRDIDRLERAIDEIRTILLVLMEKDAAERFRDDWFPRTHKFPSGGTA